MKIVCFHLNQVGDLIFSLPALKSLRDGFPESQITSVVRPAMAELLEASGLVDEVLYRKTGIKIDKVALVRELASRRFDLAVVLSQSAECAFLSFASRASRRVGFVNTTLGGLLTERVYFKHPPSTANNLRLIEALGCRVTQTSYSGLLKPSEDQLTRADRILSDFEVGSNDTIVAFSPGTSGRRSVKEWTDEGFAELARHLTNKGVKVVILGTEPAYNIVQDSSRILDLNGKTNLGEAAAILYRAKALVAVDSGILHLGAAVGTKVVGLFGPSNSDVTGPQGNGHTVIRSGVDCSPCMKTDCKLDRICMTSISASEVIRAVDQIVDKDGYGWNEDSAN